MSTTRMYVTGLQCLLDIRLPSLSPTFTFDTKTKSTPTATDWGLRITIVAPKVNCAAKALLYP